MSNAGITATDGGLSMSATVWASPRILLEPELNPSTRAGVVYSASTVDSDLFIHDDIYRISVKMTEPIAGRTNPATGKPLTTSVG